MENKIKLKTKVIKPYKSKSNLMDETTNPKPLDKFMLFYFNDKITPSVYDSIVKII